jgi:hypothetical protein
MKTKVLLSAALAGLCLLAADAIQPIKAKLGVWEITSTTQMSGMPQASAAPSIPADKLAQLPPAQRAQIEAMMKQRAGGGAPRTTVRQTCVTQEKLDKGAFSDEKSSCQRTISKSTPKSFEMHEVCTDTDGSQHTADAKYDVTGENSMKGSVKVVATRAGRTMNMNMDLTGKWLSSDCSTIKQ